MLRLLRKLWDAVGFAGLLIGIIYIPADLYGLADTYPWLLTVSGMFDRFDLVVGFAVLCVAYIFWMDLRPYLKRRHQKRGRRLTIRQMADECTPYDLLNEIETLYLQSNLPGATQGEKNAYAVANRRRKRLIQSLLERGELIAYGKLNGAAIETEIDRLFWPHATLDLTRLQAKNGDLEYIGITAERRL